MTTSDFINLVINNDNIAKVFANGYSRWMDEKEYEDINDYGRVLADTIAKYTGKISRFVSATKRPFGVKVLSGGFKFHFAMKQKGGYLVMTGAMAK